MANILMKEIEAGDTKTLNELRRVIGDDKFTPTKLQDIVGRLFVTCYMGNKNSKTSSMSRASRVASSIGSKHYDLKIDEAFDSIVGSFEKTTGLTPKYEAEGGTMVEDLALQNVTARSRMVISYLMAQLVPWSRDEKGFMLVLGTANIAEGLRGYFTKYDTSAADINPIGGINKSDMKQFLKYFADKQNMPVFREVAETKPSAELRPMTGDYKPQLDEEEMGMSYAELDLFAGLRKIERMGPLTMFSYLLLHWSEDRKMGPKDVSEKVKMFFTFYA